MRIKNLALAILAGAALLFAGHASAFLITDLNDPTGEPPGPTYSVGISSGDVGDSFTMDWLVPAGIISSDDGDNDPLPYNLQASAIFTVDSFSSTELVLTISITNLTDLGGLEGKEAVVSFGFAVDPDVTGDFAQDGEGLVFNKVDEGQGPQQTFPGGFKGIDICAFPEDNNCSGGSIDNGLQAGESDLIKLVLSGDFGLDPFATLAYFPIKFQGEFGSFEVPGTPGNGDRPPEEIPEPALLALFGVGLLIMGWAVRRRSLAIL
ncbi:hypothetical protein B1C78_13465 [Thioalkalivibrio denitrificans]|uniref:Ice-binding protein C-terminal domain-containing protein n=1 Tax=Thioalkalivibrio denitrificans TaxID=108003 RepID=A0A1V3NCN0_9GAMM|nr:cistern family PEP-CTERM protein [Thioalkalivibrio denitrificans]OOG22857.1 hypothetical protein B1C78_13465 [Thioalkalivibrio denitrificans]